MKHCTFEELNRRIGLNFELRNQVHDGMINPATCQPRISPLSEDWAERSGRYAALAAESERLYAELNRREAVNA